MNQKTQNPEANSLEGLALEADAIGNTEDQAQDAGPSQEEINEAQAMHMVEAGMQSVVLALFKMGRAVIAKSLPEIRDEWTDQAIEAPSQAAIPLLRKHMERLMQLAGSSPEAAAFVIALIPLGLGVVNAMDKAASNEARTVEAPATNV